MVSPRVIAHRLKLILTFRAPQKSQSWRIPCAYIQPTQDYLVADKAEIWFSQNFENFSLQKIPGPHFLMQSQAEQCAKFILDFDKFLETGRKFP
jgi:surfactin synthase thioesterase subunit